MENTVIVGGGGGRGMGGLGGHKTLRGSVGPLCGRVQWWISKLQMRLCQFEEIARGGGITGGCRRSLTWFAKK